MNYKKILFHKKQLSNTALIN